MSELYALRVRCWKRPRDDAYAFDRAYLRFEIFCDFFDCSNLMSSLHKPYPMTQLGDDVINVGRSCRCSARGHLKGRRCVHFSLPRVVSCISSGGLKDLSPCVLQLLDCFLQTHLDRYGSECSLSDLNTIAESCDPETNTDEEAVMTAGGGRRSATEILLDIDRRLQVMRAGFLWIWGKLLFSTARSGRNVLGLCRLFETVFVNQDTEPFSYKLTDSLQLVTADCLFL